MNIEVFRNYCLQKKGVEESFPFGETTLVFKVMGKMFALSGLDTIECEANLKCDPDWAVELIDHSYELVVSSLPKKTREDLARL